MGFKRSGYSVIAGILTPLALYLINWGMPAQALDSSNAMRALLFGISFLFVLGIALFRSISPPIYGATIAVTCFAVPFWRFATLYEQSFADRGSRRGDSTRRARLCLRLEGHWVYLTCPPSAHPQWVEIVTDSPSKPVVRVTR